MNLIVHKKIFKKRILKKNKGSKVDLDISKLKIVN
jgi:hypothetical protein